MDTNGNFINSDDILARIDELEEEYAEGDEMGLDAKDANIEDYDGELEELKDIAEQAYLKARGNIVFYAEHYFAEAMEDDAYDFGFVERDSAISSYVDWEKYAEGLKIDYSEYTIDGSTYLARD